MPLRTARRRPRPDGPRQGRPGRARRLPVGRRPEAVSRPRSARRPPQWVVDAFTEVGLQDVTSSPTPDGSTAVHGHAPGPEGAPTVLLYCHYDVQPPLGEDAWTSPMFELTERDGRWYGRGAADCKGNIVMHLTALRALQQANGGFPCGVKLICEGSEEQGTGGLEAFVPDERRPAARRRDPRRRHGQLRGRRADADDDAARDDEHRRHARRRSAARCTPACSAARRRTRSSALIQLLATLHDEHGNTTIDGLDERRRTGTASSTRPSSSAPTRRCSTASS